MLAAKKIPLKDKRVRSMQDMIRNGITMRIEGLLGEKPPTAGQSKGEAPMALRFRDAIKRGFTITQAEQVRAAYGMSQKNFFELVGVSSRTASRKHSANTRLDVPSSDRLLRLARIMALAVEVFEDNEAARNWLYKKQKALANMRPIDMLDFEDGARAVEELLNAIEYGIYHRMWKEPAKPSKRLTPPRKAKDHPGGR